MSVFQQKKRAVLLIDGSNNYEAMVAINLRLDYKKLLAHYDRETNLRRAYYFTAVRPNGGMSDGLRKTLDWLDYNGYKMVTKNTKSFVDNEGTRIIKGNMDIEIAVTAMKMAPFIDDLYLFSGDGDFVYLVDALQQLNVRVIVVSTLNSNPPMIADELRRMADQFIELDSFRGKLTKESDT